MRYHYLDRDNLLKHIAQWVCRNKGKLQIWVSRNSVRYTAMEVLIAENDEAAAAALKGKIRKDFWPPDEAFDAHACRVYYAGEDGCGKAVAAMRKEFLRGLLCSKLQAIRDAAHCARCGVFLSSQSDADKAVDGWEAAAYEKGGTALVDVMNTRLYMDTKHLIAQAVQDDSDVEVEVNILDEFLAVGVFTEADYLFMRHNPKADIVDDRVVFATDLRSRNEKMKDAVVFEIGRLKANNNRLRRQLQEKRAQQTKRKHRVSSSSSDSSSDEEADAKTTKCSSSAPKKKQRQSPSPVRRVESKSESNDENMDLDVPMPSEAAAKIDARRCRRSCHQSPPPPAQKTISPPNEANNCTSPRRSTTSSDSSALDQPMTAAQTREHDLRRHQRSHSSPTVKKIPKKKATTKRQSAPKRPQHAASRSPSEEMNDGIFKLADFVNEFEALALRHSLYFCVENEVFVLMLSTEMNNQWFSRLLMLRDEHSTIRLAEFTGCQEEFNENVEYWIKADYAGPEQLMEALNIKCVEYFQQSQAQQQQQALQC